MADYASTVTLAMPRPQRLWGSGWGMLVGTIDITNYNSTTTEETGITKFFKAFTVGGTSLKCFLVCQSTTDNGYTLDFTPSTGTFKAYREAGTGSAARSEAANDTDVGAAEFLCVGVVA